MNPRLLLLALWAALAPVAQAQTANIALGKPIFASGVLIGGYPVANVVDGNPATFTHPNAGSGTNGFYYQIDLGQACTLDRMVLVNRGDCCPERLSRYRVSVYADNAGAPGALTWTADVRSDGSNSGMGGSDTITGALNVAGTFAGRFVRITNISNEGYNPQIAEVEVYRAPLPLVRYFTVNHGNITQTGNPNLPTSATLSWLVDGATSVAIDQGIGAVANPTGSTNVAPPTTRTYTLTATNAAGSVTAALTIGVDEVTYAPKLTEFLANNNSGLEDEDGDNSDWIEIFNPNIFTLNLDGFYLTDVATQKTKWRIPSITVPAGGYLVLFASGKNRIQPGSPAHTNFSLAASGEYVALVDKDGTTVLTQFPADYPATSLYPAQFGDKSYGLNTGNVPAFFVPPTPGAANTAGFTAVVADTNFLPKRGFFDAPISVAITTATAGATIRYTTDGAKPTEATGTVYSGPIAITTTTTLRAFAFKAGAAATNVDTNTYIFPASVVASGVMNTAITQDPAYAPQMIAALKDIPSVSLVLPNAGAIHDTTEIETSIEYIRPDGVAGTQEDCGITFFGGAFTAFAKESFRLYFRGDYGAAKLKYPLFEGYARGLAPATEFDSLELRNGSHDMVERGFYMSNIFTDATMLGMGRMNPHGRFVHLYINGTYWGMYHMRERWNAAMHADYLGGLKEDYEAIAGNLNVGGWAVPGTPFDGDGSAWDRIKSLRSDYTAIRPYLDVPQFADYMLMFMFGDSEDEYRCVGPVLEGSGFKFLLNDADGFLRTSAGDRTARSTPGVQNGDGPGSLFSMLHASGDADYRLMLADQIHRHFFNDGAMTPAKNIARLQALCTEIQRAIIPECARWGYRTPANWASARDNILANWFPSRTAAYISILRNAGFYPTVDAPEFNQHGGSIAANFSLTMTTPTGGAATYYTLDGTDPRTTGPVFTPLIYVDTTTPRKYRVPTGASDGFNTASIPNLVAYYPLDANANDVIASFPGTLTGGAALTAPGKFGAKAVSLNGTSQSVDLGNPAALQITGQITIAAWVKATATNGIRNILNKGHAFSPNGEITLRIVDGQYQGGSWNGANHIAVSAAGQAASDVGQWVHLAIVYDGSATWRLYRNGTQIGSTVDGTGAVAVGANWAIGARGGGGERFFAGTIDEVCIFNRGLTAAEVGQVYANTGLSTGALWVAPAYSTAGWATANGGLGFDTEGTFTPHVAANTQAAMLNVNASLLTRAEFTLTAGEVAQTKVLHLNVRSDDGYVAYLNGTRIASRNAPSTLNGIAAATAETPDASAIVAGTVDVTAFIPQLINGTNILAIHGLNAAAANNDFLLSATLTAATTPAGLAPGAILYTGPIVPGVSRHVQTRANLNGVWSALNEAFFQVGASAVPPGSLLVSELCYNPAGDDDAEFIELMNAGATAINLRGVKFTSGVEFTFPDNRDTILSPGQRLVLVDSQFTFSQRYGWEEKVAGIYGGNLANDGERITLAADDGTTVLVDFTFDDAAPWPTDAGGIGHSLTLIAPAPGVNLGDPAQWRPSTAIDGSPNSGDSTAFTGSPTANADGDSLTALMEFALNTSDLVQNTAPLQLLWTGTAWDIIYDHAAAADSAGLIPQVSPDLFTWNGPGPANWLTFAGRTVLANGRHRSTWHLGPAFPSADRLCVRLRAALP